MESIGRQVCRGAAAGGRCRDGIAVVAGKAADDSLRRLVFFPACRFAPPASNYPQGVSVAALVCHPLNRAKKRASTNNRRKQGSGHGEKTKKQPP